MPSSARKLLTNLHLCVGLVAAPFLIVLGITGALMVFEPQLDDLLNARTNLVQPAGRALPVDSLWARLAPEHPFGQLVAVLLPRDERHSYAFILSSRVERRPPQAYFVDPYTARVIGTDADVNDGVAKLHSLHLRLLAGRAGEEVVIAAGIALLFLAVTGLILWWPGKVFRVRWSASGPRFTLDLHKALGAYAWIFLTIFALTAIVIHWNEAAERALASATGSGPGKPLPRPAATCGAKPMLSPGALIAAAGAAVTGAHVTSIGMPTPKNSLVRVNMKFPEDGTPAGRTLAIVEGCTGRIMYLQTSRTAPLAYRMARVWNREIHTGDILGWPTRILAALMSLTLPLMAITGPMIWWSRRGSRVEGRGSSNTKRRARP